MRLSDVALQVPRLDIVESFSSKSKITVYCSSSGSMQ